MRGRWRAAPAAWSAPRPRSTGVATTLPDLDRAASHADPLAFIDG
ncbi:hypothetical protein [Cellulomonas shaoxiangyii]|nr:hypothetical protein [Cellulomonas shaoxiangyii]